MMKRFAYGFRTVLACAAVASLGSTVARAGISLGDYNLITTGDVTDGSDVQGRVLIGGTLNSNNFAFGGHLGTPPLTPPAGIFNALASNVTNLSNNGKNFVFGSGGPIGGQTADPTATATYTSGVSSFLSSVSASYAALATNSTVNATDRNQIAFNAAPTTIGGHGVAVFSVDQSFFTSSGTVNSLTGVSAGDTVVINVTGSGALNASGGLNFSAISNASNQANIIFNFENTTALNGITNLGGSILAPGAVLNTSSSLVGGIYVQSITSVGEIDRPFSNGTEVNGFQGYVPSAVPEPSSIVLMLSALGIGGVARRWKGRFAR